MKRFFLRRAQKTSWLRLSALLAVTGAIVVAQGSAWGQDAARSGNATAQTPESAARPKPAAAPSGNIENGKKLFMADGCYQCHGFVGQGSTATGARIGPPAFHSRQWWTTFVIPPARCRPTQAR